MRDRFNNHTPDLSMLFKIATVLDTFGLYRVASAIDYAALRLVKTAVKSGDSREVDDFIDEVNSNPRFTKEFRDWISKEIYKHITSSIDTTRLNRYFDLAIQDGKEKRDAGKEAISAYLEDTPDAIQSMFNTLQISDVKDAAEIIFLYFSDRKIKDVYKKTLAVAYNEARQALSKMIDKGREVSPDLLRLIRDDNALVEYIDRNPNIPGSTLVAEVINKERHPSPEQIESIRARCEKESQDGVHCLYMNHYRMIATNQERAVSIRDSYGNFVATLSFSPSSKLLEMKGHNNSSIGDRADAPKITSWLKSMKDAGYIKSLDCDDWNEAYRPPEPLSVAEAISHFREHNSDDVIIEAIRYLMLKSVGQPVWGQALYAYCIGSLERHTMPEYAALSWLGDKYGYSWPKESQHNWSADVAEFLVHYTRGQIDLSKYRISVSSVTGLRGYTQPVKEVILYGWIKHATSRTEVLIYLTTLDMIDAEYSSIEKMYDGLLRRGGFSKQIYEYLRRFPRVGPLPDIESLSVHDFIALTNELGNVSIREHSGIVERIRHILDSRVPIPIELAIRFQMVLYNYVDSQYLVDNYEQFNLRSMWESFYARYVNANEKFSEFLSVLFKKHGAKKYEQQLWDLVEEYGPVFDAILDAIDDNKVSIDIDLDKLLKEISMGGSYKQLEFMLKRIPNPRTLTLASDGWGAYRLVDNDRVITVGAHIDAPEMLLLYHYDIISHAQAFDAVLGSWPEVLHKVPQEYLNKLYENTNDSGRVELRKKMPPKYRKDFVEIDALEQAERSEVGHGSKKHDYYSGRRVPR